ncbi:MAG: hypothetical protein AAB388_01110 [Patescibacteria group bacterium]
MYNDTRWSGWLYVIPVAMFFLSCIGPIKEIVRTAEVEKELRISQLPQLPLEEIEFRLTRLQGELSQIQKGTLEQYFTLLAEAFVLSDASTRLDLEAGKWEQDSRGAPVAPSRIHAMAAERLRSTIGSRQNDFGFSTATREEIDAARATVVLPDVNRETASFAGVWQQIGKAYLLLALFAAPVFYILRLQRSDLKIGIEFPRIIFWSSIWFIGIFRYPDNIDWSQQRRDFMRFIAALGSMLLSFAGMGVAQAKAKSGEKTSGSEIEMVSENTPKTISLLDPPSPQLLPTLQIGGIKVDAFGWSFVTFDTAANDEFAVRNARFRTIAKTSKTEVFFQSNVLKDGKLFKDFAVEQFWVGYQIDPNLRVKAGRLFLSPSDTLLPPFLEETIAGQHLPVQFFGNGLTLEGSLDKDWSFAVDLTGKSDTPTFSNDQFDRLDYGGFLKRKTAHGFVRLSVQHAGDTRVLFDTVQTFGDHKLRGAVHYRTTDEQVGGYVFYQYMVGKHLRAFGQLEHTSGDLIGLVGISIPANDNLDLSAEVRSNGTFGARVRARF